MTDIISSHTIQVDSFLVGLNIKYVLKLVQIFDNLKEVTLVLWLLQSPPPKLHHTDSFPTTSSIHVGSFSAVKNHSICKTFSFKAVPLFPFVSTQPLQHRLFWWNLFGSSRPIPTYHKSHRNGHYVTLPLHCPAIDKIRSGSNANWLPRC